MTNDLASVGSVGSVGSVREVLDELKNWFSRYVFVLRPQDLDLLALWTLHTWVCEITYTTPRLLVDSPVPGSGKTTLLEHLSRLAYRPIQMATISSSAMLARVTSTGARTLLIDEADRALNPKRPGVEDLIAVLNSGYKRGGFRPVLVPRNKTWELEEMATFSPVAIAGNTPLLPDDTKSRCITIRLLPDRLGLVRESDWELLEPEAAELAARLQTIAQTHRVDLEKAKPLLPPNCTGRLREKWKPLMAIASIASHSWEQTVIELVDADIAHVKALQESGEAHLSTNHQLATDLYQIFTNEKGFIATNLIVSKLIEINPEYWSGQSNYGKELTAQRLGRLLSNSFGISSSRVGDSPRGYSDRQFEDVWRQLGISPSEPTEPTEPTGDLF